MILIACYFKFLLILCKIIFLTFSYFALLHYPPASHFYTTTSGWQGPFFTDNLTLSHSHLAILPISLSKDNVNPITSRLLSSFRDKMERPKPRPFMTYFQDLQRAIVAKYRPSNSTVTSATPTFSEFVDYVIESTANLTTARDWTLNVSMSLP